MALRTRKLSGAFEKRAPGPRTISEQVIGRRLKWLGHGSRMPLDQNSKIALTWVPEGKHRRGRPRETWQRTINNERVRASRIQDKDNDPRHALLEKEHYNTQVYRFHPLIYLLLFPDSIANT